MARKTQAKTTKSKAPTKPKEPAKPPEQGAPPPTPFEEAIKVLADIISGYVSQDPHGKYITISANQALAVLQNEHDKLKPKKE